MAYRRLVGAVLAAALAACAKKAALPDIVLPTLASREAPSLATCPAAKCLTVYVAPWCGYCRASTPMIRRVRDFLKGRDVAVRVVVGMDELSAVRAYAADFGPDTLLDPDNAFGVAGGVPHFYVSDGSGRIQRELAGAPMGIEDPAQYAAAFGLP